MTLTQLTNQELITELKKRIQEDTLRTQFTADQFEEKSKSLFSYLGNKELLFLVALTVGFTFLICYSIKVTTRSATGAILKFQEPSKNQIEI